MPTTARLPDLATDYRLKPERQFIKESGDRNIPGVAMAAGAATFQLRLDAC